MKQLEDFLDTPAEIVAEEEPPVVEQEPEPAPVEPEAEPVEAAKPDEPAPVPDDVTGLKSALQAERAKRNDYKGERDRLAGEMAALKAQLETIQKAPAPVVQQQAVAPQPVRVPNPVEDPEGFAQFQEQRLEQRLFNERLNLSESMLRHQLGNEEVDAKIEAFKKAATANPALRAELSTQPNPYKWAYETGQRLLAMDEIGTDPAAYRAKLEADIRAKLQAEFAAAAPAAAAPRVALPQSLGTARSAAPRNAVVDNVPTDFDDILKRKRG